MRRIHFGDFNGMKIQSFQGDKNQANRTYFSVFVRSLNSYNETELIFIVYWSYCYTEGCRVCKREIQVRNCRANKLMWQLEHIQYHHQHIDITKKYT
mmetsp:Transcript_6714/g.19877  ORF Transcript_6714/g.19877 Transcript_6714/m.19877 type:complete len:97 (+) Transcript_6714:818-1108(+)